MRVLYCSWTQASNSNCTSAADLIKTVIHFAQAQTDQNNALYSMIWSKWCYNVHGRKPAIVITQAQLFWSKWWFILHKHKLIKTVRFVQRSDQNSDSLHKHSYLIKTVRSVQRLFSHSLQLSSFLSTTMVECLQSSSMLRPNPLQWIASTHQPQNHQNRAHTVKANPLRETL